MNRLVVIGWLGMKTAYLNMSREEAIRRYRAENDGEDPPPGIEEFEFVDTFATYSAYPSSHDQSNTQG